MFDERVVSLASIPIYLATHLELPVLLLLVLLLLDGRGRRRPSHASTTTEAAPAEPPTTAPQCRQQGRAPPACPSYSSQERRGRRPCGGGWCDSRGSRLLLPVLLRPQRPGRAGQADARPQEPARRCQEPLLLGAVPALPAQLVVQALDPLLLLPHLVLPQRRAQGGGHGRASATQDREEAGPKYRAGLGVLSLGLVEEAQEVLALECGPVLALHGEALAQRPQGLGVRGGPALL